jgi:hypothetical protein
MFREVAVSEFTWLRLGVVDQFYFFGLLGEGAGCAAGAGAG